MPTQTLLNELHEAFKASPVYNKLSPAEQSQIREKYATATDEEIHVALGLMRQAAEFSAELDAEQEAISRAQVKLVPELKEATHQAEKAMLKEAQAKGDASSEKEAEDLIRGIEGVSKSSEPTKKKKFLGIF